MIATLVPTGPLLGLKPLIVGADGDGEVAGAGRRSAGVVTVIGPVVAPVGTVAVIWVEELTVKLVALAPLKVTAVAPVKPAPVMVTLVPTGPLLGLKR